MRLGFIAFGGLLSSVRATFCPTSTLNSMAFFQQAALAVEEGQPFYGISPQRILVLVQAFSGLQNMRVGRNGQTTNRTMTRDLERSFRFQYDLSEVQYDSLTSLYDAGGVGDTTEAFVSSLPPATTGVYSTFVKRCFAHDQIMCCTKKLQVRALRATVYERGSCYEARHFVKTCMSCGVSYYLNKRVLPVAHEGDRYLWHMFYPWTSGALPLHITNKSGKSVFSVDFLTDVALSQYKFSSGFTTLAENYNDTVRRSETGTIPLSADALIEAWSLFAILKHRQGVGPWMWVAPAGQTLNADDPQEVAVKDVVGQQGGANYWAGLRVVMEELLEKFWQTVPWARHVCNRCTKNVTLDDGQATTVRVMAADGVVNTRWTKCKVLHCTQDLSSGRGQRYCHVHDPVYGPYCAVTSIGDEPACDSLHQPGRLTCPQHSYMEDDWIYWNHFGSYRRKQRARAQGIHYEPERISQYRAMFAKQNSHGNFVVHLNCGIIAGSAPLHESEGMAEVDRCLNDILPLHRTRPDIMFFDKACVLDRYLDNQQDASWPMTRWIVDRFHFAGHREAYCDEFNSPEDKNDPTLWHLGPDNDPAFNWNSSMAESNNSWISSLGHVVKPMPRVLGQFVLNQNMLVHNEKLLNKRLIHENPTFIV